MFIFVYYKETKSIEVSPESSIDIIKEKLGIKDSFSIEIYWKEKLLPLGKSFNYYGIKQYDMLYLFVITGLDAAPIDNLKDENDLTIGFDMKYIKRDELYVNLIHFDLKMTNSENYGYYKKFKVDVVGGFYAIDDLDILKNYFEQIKDKNINFIVISSGTSGKDVIPLCKKYPFVKEVIIFCANYSYNEHYLKEYPGYVNKVFTSISSVYNYIKTFTQQNKQQIKNNNFMEKYKFSSEEIKMNRQYEQTPVITASEYDNCYFLVHRAYSHFFSDINNRGEVSIFKKENFCKISDFLHQIQYYGKINGNDFNDLLDFFRGLADIYDNNTFVEKSINKYTTEIWYGLSRTMRNFDSGLVKFAYYMGPLLYGLNKYVKDNPSFAMSKDMILCRNMTISGLEFYLYKLNVGHIICFPSLSSASSGEKNSFTPTSNALKTNKISNDSMKVKMMIKYKHSEGNISPGIIIEDKKGHDGEYISDSPQEREVILFPFTFLKINNIKQMNNHGGNPPIIEAEIINRKSYLEYTLKNDVEKRLLLSSLD